MVRRRALANSARQASMAAYQQLWPNSSQMNPQTVLVPSMPEYWHSICNKMGGAIPRMAVLTPPQASSRRLTRLRRQMMRLPKEGVNLTNFVTNYMQQSIMQQQRLQQQQQQQQPPPQPPQQPQQPSQMSYQHVWDRSCYGSPMRESGSIMNKFYRPQAAAQPSQDKYYSPAANRSSNKTYDYPATTSQLQLQWQQQQTQLQQQFKQYQMQQQTKQVPVSILKRQSRSEAGQSFATGLQIFNSLRSKRSPRNSVASKYNEPRVELKGVPEVPPKPKKTGRATAFKKEPPKPKQATHHGPKIRNPQRTSSSLVASISENAPADS